MNQPSHTGVRILEERSVHRAWLFQVELGIGVSNRIVEIRLDWADYEHWSRGRLTPSEVIAGVIACAIAIAGIETIPPCCDASTLRRLAPGLDERVGAFLDR